MTTPQNTTTDPQHRTSHQPATDHVKLRDLEEEESDTGLMAIRMPLSSTALARDGDDFSRERLDGWQRQISSGSGVPAFLDHGANSDISSSRYSAVGKIGVWRDPSLEERDGETDLDATAVLMDPETLPEAAGPVREALTTLREQVERDIPISASVGWREDDAYPGDSDLLEGSIVGIPSDPRASSVSADASKAQAATRSAVSAATDVSRETLAEEFGTKRDGQSPDPHDLLEDRSGVTREESSSSPPRPRDLLE